MSPDFHSDKYEFVKKLYRAFKELPSDIIIDTTKLEPEKIFQIALKAIEMYKIPYSESVW